MRDPADLGPKYMYDFDSLVEANRGISTTFGPPALCGGGINPACLGGEVSVWKLDDRKVSQVADLGEHSGALEVRFIEKQGVRRGFINTPGTAAVWLAHDDDGDGVFTFQQVLGPEDGFVLPVDMLLSYDGRYRDLAVRRRQEFGTAYVRQPRRKGLGQLRRRPEEDQPRASRPTHDVVRSERSAGAGWTLTKIGGRRLTCPLTAARETATRAQDSSRS